MAARYIWRGSFTGIATTGVINGRSLLKVMTITNKTSGIVMLNIIVKTTNEGELNIAPLNLRLGAGESYREWNVNLEDRDELILKSSGKVDYYCSFGHPEVGDVTR